jgi:amidophosphoribosyltransferase
LKGDVKPGEILEINPVCGLKIQEPQLCGKPSYCLFEFIYFARPDSILEGVSVENVRHKLGINLARNDNIDCENKIVIPIPDSGRSAAMGYAWESKVPYEEGLMKNRYLWDLKSDVNEKLNPIKAIVKSKDIILIDDSMLSGVTLKKIISMLRKAGARSIHVRISAPPIIDNCEFNDSFSNRDLLIAYQEKSKSQENFVEEIKKYIGADSLKFQTIEGLIDAIGLDESLMCFDCLKEKIVKKEESKSSEINIIV